MSIYRPEEVRYLKLDSLKQERAFYRNCWNEVIHQYGIDVDYYRRRTNYVTQNESSAMLYGHNNVAVYDKKSKIRVKADYNDYNFILNDEGFVPSDSLVLYFGINDFATSFVDDIGQFREFPIESEMTGVATIKNGFIYVPFRTKPYSGTAVIPVIAGQSRVNVEIEDVNNPTRRCLSVAWNPYIRRSFATDYKDGFFSLNLYCDYTPNGGNKVNYVLHGGVLYSDFFQDDTIIEKIHPNVGDVIEINYHTNDMEIEQYEITELVQRKPTNQDGLSPMLGKVVFKCMAVRRITSHENCIDNPPDQKASVNKQAEYEKNRSDAIKSNYSWENDSGHKNHSKYYGGYQQPEVYSDDRNGGLTANINSIFSYDQWKYNWPDCKLVDGQYDICNFSDNSKLYTDGINLTWELADGSKHNITSIPASSVQFIDGKIPNMMYIRVENGQLVYYTADMNTRVQLTEFENPHSDGFQYFENFSYKDVGYVSNDGYYIFRNNKIALNSFNNERLIAFNGYGTEPAEMTYIVKELDK